MFGSSSRENSTSITAPMHWTMVPSFAAVEVIFGVPSVRFASNGGRAADDLGEFLRDRRLAGLVVDQLQLVDDRPGVVGRGLHRDHAGALLRSDVLVDRLVDDRLDVA